MKKISTSYPMILVLLCTLLAAGCAKKPTPAPLAVEEPPAKVEVAKEEPAPVETAPAAQQPVAKEVVPVADLERVHFAFDQFALSAEAREVLAANAVLLQTSPGLRVTIEGHCDSRGSDEYNLALGERRAKAARDYLVSLGVAADRLDTISYGEEQPIDPAGDEQAWAKNRRAEFKALN